MKSFALLCLGSTLLLGACATEPITPPESTPSAISISSTPTPVASPSSHSPSQPEKSATPTQTPIPGPTPYDDFGPHYPPNYPEELKSSERCQSNGERPLSQKAHIQRTGSFIQSQFNTVNEFTGWPRFCKGALQDKLFIIDHDQLLVFDPVTNKQDILFDFGTRWNQEKHAPILGLQSCLVNTQGEFYVTYRTPPIEEKELSRSLNYASGVYKINLQTKTLTPIRYQPHPIAQMRYTLPLSPLPTNFAYESGYYNLGLALSPQDDVFISTGMSLRKVNAQNEAVSLLHAYEAGAWSESAFGEFPAKLENNELIGSDGGRANIRSVDLLFFDDKNNLFINSQQSKALFRMDVNKNMIYMNNIKGVQNFQANYYQYSGLPGASHLQYFSKNRVFLGLSGNTPGIVTRDGCLQFVIPQEYSVPLKRKPFSSLGITSENEIYAIENESKEIVRVILDSDIAETEQWEPPQAWKDATGLD